MKKKYLKYLPKIFSYLYLFMGYSYIILYISYNIRITGKPEGWAFMLFKALFFFFAYVGINHVLIRRIIMKSTKSLVIIEALLFIAMLTLVISDMLYELYIYEDVYIPIISSFRLYTYE
jgi:hypothetical protein